MFKAILIDKDDSGQRVRLETLDESRLPDGDVTVRVNCSSLNYKDALAITGKGQVVRQFPIVPGIDLAGTIETSNTGAYRPGDAVLLNGWGVGETHWGGLAEKARLDSRWLIPLPTEFSAQQAMAIGTAGFTAMLSVMALERHGVKPQQGPVLVTGANGGLGSYAIALLSRLGYQVVASTGRVAEMDYLKELGANKVIDRSELSELGRPLAKARWAGAIDSLGSHTLANVLAGTSENGVVIACGLAQGMDLPSSVAPFILRGVSLVGIESVRQSYENRIEAWRRLSGLLTVEQLNVITQLISLEEVIDKSESLLRGQVRGRIVVDMTR